MVDGPGVRTVVFFQGCDLRCEGCQNPSSWELNAGEKLTVEELADLLKTYSVNKKITLSGGEPLVQKEGILALVKLLDGFDIALYTGHDEKDVPKEILPYLTYLKTGNFQKNKKTTVAPYVGSTNQTFRRVNHAEV